MPNGERSGFASWAEHCGALRCILGQDNLLSQCLFSLRFRNGYGEFYGGGNPAMDKHPIQGGGGVGSRNTPSRFMLKKPG